jgi:hypothetical protein
MRTRILLATSLRAVSLDPFSLQERDPCTLPPGTCVEGAVFALRQAEQTNLQHVTVRVVEEDGWVAMKRVSVADLRAALEAHTSTC